VFIVQTLNYGLRDELYQLGVNKTFKCFFEYHLRNNSIIKNMQKKKKNILIRNT